jgi:sugar/nucleoside kinase (ribokinase family)
VSSETQFDLSVVGELNLDLVLYGLPEKLEFDREHLATDLRLTLGSSSAIFAHNFALLGNRVGFSSAVGSDPLGDLCLARLAESGAELSRVRHFPGRQTGLTVVLPGAKQRYILTYPGVMAEMRFADLDLDYVFSARHLHLSSYFLQTALRPDVPKLFGLAKKAGLTTSLDTNDDPQGRWESDVFEAMRFVDVLLPNESEACRLAGCADLAAAAERLSGEVPLLVIKRGEKGALARRGQETYRVAAATTAAVDTIGAGDSFDAGFLHQFIRGGKIEDCLRYGNLAGALSTTRQGGTEAFRDAAHRSAFMNR